MCASFSRFLVAFTVVAFTAVNSARPDEPAADALVQQRIKAALSRWEAASRDVRPPTDEDEHVAYAVHKSTSSGHEIAVALEFQSPVRAEALQQKYRWTRIEETGDVIRLHAEPLEAVEQLFYSGFELELDASSGLPVAVRFVDRNGTKKNESLKLAVRPRRASDKGGIQLTSAAEQAPPPGLRMAQKPLEPLDEQTGAEAAEPTKVSPELDALLKNWEAAATKQRTLDAEFTRRVYDGTYQTETISRGRIYLERPDKGRLEIVGITPWSTESARKDPATGKRYSLVADSSATWVLTESHLLHLNPDMKVADKIELPADDNPREIAPRGGWYTVFAPLGIRKLCNDVLSSLGVGQVDDLRTNYHLTLVKRQAGAVWVMAKPPNDRTAALMKELMIILDESTWLPRASKCIDPSGNLETVYIFSNWKVNQPLESSDHPLEPDLTGYKVHTSTQQQNKTDRRDAEAQRKPDDSKATVGE